MELSQEVKDMLIDDINNSNIEGMKATLDIILEKPVEHNPNIIPVEFKLSTIKYLEEVQDDLRTGSKGRMEYDLSQVIELMVTMSIPAYRKEKAARQKFTA